jgi:hypothetical protein
LGHNEEQRKAKHRFGKKDSRYYARSQENEFEADIWAQDVLCGEYNKKHPTIFPPLLEACPLIFMLLSDLLQYVSKNIDDQCVNRYLDKSTQLYSYGSYNQSTHPSNKDRFRRLYEYNKDKSTWKSRQFIKATGLVLSSLSTDFTWFIKEYGPKENKGSSSIHESLKNIRTDLHEIITVENEKIVNQKKIAGPVLILALDAANKIGAEKSGCGHTQFVILGPRIDVLLEEIPKNPDILSTLQQKTNCIVCGKRLNGVVTTFADEIDPNVLQQIQHSYPCPVFSVPHGVLFEDILSGFSEKSISDAEKHLVVCLGTEVFRET